MPRVSIKAIIIENERLLCLQNQAPNGEIYYSLPGGGQEHGETIPQALQRECIEEIGMRVQPGNVLFIRDYIAANHQFAATSQEVHQIEIMMEARILEVLDPNAGHHVQPDDDQIGIEWIAVEQLPQANFYPKRLIEPILEYQARRQAMVYLGDVN